MTRMSCSLCCAVKSVPGRHRQCYGEEDDVLVHIVATHVHMLCATRWKLVHEQYKCCNVLEAGFILLLIRF